MRKKSEALFYKKNNEKFIFLLSKYCLNWIIIPGHKDRSHRHDSN